MIASFLVSPHVMKDVMNVARLHRPQKHALAQEIQLGLCQAIPEKYHSFVAVGIVTRAAHL